VCKSCIYKSLKSNQCWESETTRPTLLSEKEHFKFLPRQLPRGIVVLSLIPFALFPVSSLSIPSLSKEGMPIGIDKELTSLYE